LLASAGFTLTFYPIMRAFQLGQIQCWLYCLFVLALWAWLAERKTMAGSLIGLICVIKPQLGLFALWGLLRKEWRFVGGIIVTAGTLGLISLWTFGLANHLDYLPVLSFLSQHGESYFPNQSVNGLLHRLFLIGAKEPVNPFTFPPYNFWVYAGTLLSSGVLIAAALFWRRRQAERAGVIDFAIAALSFTMASPIAWEHHYGILLPLFAIALPVALAPQPKPRGIVLLTAAFMLCNNYYQFVNLLASSPFNFLQSYLFFGALLFLFDLYGLRAFQQSHSGSDR
jgi:alpha-1,2-mannosyltransferase